MSETVEAKNLDGSIAFLPLNGLTQNFSYTGTKIKSIGVTYNNKNYREDFDYGQGIASVGVENEGEFTTLNELVPTEGSGAVLVPLMSVVNVTLVDGGGDYSVNDELYLVGGVVVSLATKLKVTAVDEDGAITAFDVITNGAYTTLPVNPASTTGGGGTGAQFNATWKVISVGVGAAGTGYDSNTVINPTGDIMSPPAFSVALTAIASDAKILAIKQWRQV